MQARATEKVLSYSLEVGQGLVTPCYKQSACYRTPHSLGLWQILYNEPNNWKWTSYLENGMCGVSIGQGHYRQLQDNYNSTKLHLVGSTIQATKSRSTWWVQHVVHMGGNSNIYKVLVRKPDRNNLKDLGKERSNIPKWTFKETGWQSVRWIHLTQARDMWQAIMNKLINRQYTQKLVPCSSGNPSMHTSVYKITTCKMMLMYRITVTTHFLLTHLTYKTLNNAFVGWDECLHNEAKYFQPHQIQHIKT